MHSAGTPATLAALIAGPVVRRLPEAPARGRVLAVFRAAAYIEAEALLIAIGARGMEPGPISVASSAPASIDWRSLGLEPGRDAWISRHEIRIDGMLKISVRKAQIWQPPRWPSPSCPAAIISGIELARRLASSKADSGIAAHIDPDFLPGPTDHEGCAAAEAIADARDWLDHALTLAPSATVPGPVWARPLCGLGQGLTPAGDDFLGGMMIALHAVGRRRVCEAIWSIVETCTEERTNVISSALLHEASKGTGSASVHAAIAGLLRGDREMIRAGVALMFRIGHTSGCDALAGAVTVLDCWVRQHGVAALRHQEGIAGTRQAIGSVAGRPLAGASGARPSTR